MIRCRPRLWRSRCARPLRYFGVILQRNVIAYRHGLALYHAAHARWALATVQRLQLLEYVGIRLRTTLVMPHILHPGGHRSEEHTSELQSLMRISYAVFCLKKKTKENL